MTTYTNFTIKEMCFQDRSKSPVEPQGSLEHSASTIAVQKGLKKMSSTTGHHHFN